MHTQAHSTAAPASREGANSSSPADQPCQAAVRPCMQQQPRTRVHSCTHPRRRGLLLLQLLIKGCLLPSRAGTQTACNTVTVTAAPAPCEQAVNPQPYMQLCQRRPTHQTLHGAASVTPLASAVAAPTAPQQAAHPSQHQHSQQQTQVCSAV
jgi:hypothetical protein